jgi:hypothetical protein
MFFVKWAPTDNYRRARRGTDAVTSAHGLGYQACMRNAFFDCSRKTQIGHGLPRMA